MYDYLMDALPQAGYQRYEISNFAWPGQASRHNQVYWHYDPYMAFGCGACRFNGKRRETSPAVFRNIFQGAPGSGNPYPETAGGAGLYEPENCQGAEPDRFRPADRRTAFFPFYETAWESAIPRAGWSRRGTIST